MNNDLTLLWILGCACVSFMMQAGFTLLETGSVRAKNSVNVAMKNLADFVVVGVIYAFWGYHLANGNSLFSFSTFPVNTSSAPLVLFSIMFVATAATIVSGCVAERMSFRGYIIASIVMAALIYPIVAFWVWNPAGWLNQLGFQDFAGGTVVHIVGGIVGLVGTYIIGPRSDRFVSFTYSDELPSNDHTLATLGIFFLLFAWMGFNGGSLYQFNDQVPLIIFNTLLTAAVSGTTALLFVIRRRHVPVFFILNSILGGLVAITACANLARMEDLLILGVLSTFIVHFSEKLLIKFKIDDPIGAVSAHFFCGILGTLYAALLIENDASLYMRFTVQLIGIVSVSLWAGGIAILLFSLLKLFSMHRVNSDDEKQGLNISEHGIKMSWLETLNTIDKISTEGDYSQRVPVEVGTEAGDVATSFNHLMDKLENNINILHKISQGQLKDIVVQPSSEKDLLANSLQTMVESLCDLIDEAEQQITSKNALLDKNEQSVKDLISKFKHTQIQLMKEEKMAALTNMITGVAHELNTPLGVTITSMSLLQDCITKITQAFHEKTMTVAEMKQFLHTANDCLDMMLRNVQRSAELVDRLRSIDQKLTPENNQQIQLHDLLTEITQDLNEQLSNYRIATHIACSTSLRVTLPIFALRNVLEELITNSIMHGFSHLEERDNNQIQISADVVQNQLVMQIKDNGNGVNTEACSKLFQPFFTTMRSNGGTGLALHMVYNICTQKFAGNIEVAGENGCTFTITIPMSEEELAAVPS
ncbi:ATP-binding protein [Vibrio tapetis]|uniref:histidine kinase n=1 Tax=Vibrio tapetis subsp. tapetis TaxID=1671868 RepID=A0A2N8Z9J6_9VIBR|nr:ATP-binding protein [Vibrio tapetis]SON48552.1 Ammonium transporter family protein [Vibrio tapetis subsp. tapetis]